MSLSSQIKACRLAKNLTQEQLAAVLGVSPQAVSKWETSDTYPDGALLIPLADALGVSLDELFDHRAASMAEISAKIRRLLYDTDAQRRISVARDICWQIEKGLFACKTVTEDAYDPNELERLTSASYILDDTGFTHVSNGPLPFFLLAPQPNEGFGDLFSDRAHLQSIFSALSHPATVDALAYLCRHCEGFTFDAPYLARECAIPKEQIGEVLTDLITLRTLGRADTLINGIPRTLYHSSPNHRILALLLLAKELGYQGHYCYQSHIRTLPYFEEG